MSSLNARPVGGYAVLVESSIPSIAALLGASLLASFASTSLGAGGSLLLASMATVLPAAVVIPVHACVTLAGNLNRWALLRRLVDYKVLVPFASGTAIGLILAYPFIGRISDAALQIILGLFLLIAAWWRPRNLNADGPNYPLQCGIVTSFLSVFVGATKPMLTALFGQRFDDHKIVVATSNACATLQHAGKIGVFSIASFAFLQYWQLIMALIVASAIGAILGRLFTFWANPDKLKLVFRVLVTVLAVNVLATGLGLHPWS